MIKVKQKRNPDPNFERRNTQCGFICVNSRAVKSGINVMLIKLVHNIDEKYINYGIDDERIKGILRILDSVIGGGRDY